ncbi:rna-directed dna polymerase from mobile element jockey-like [Limosa lapponica baueri]|uniref:Rna-directed dna polymerase from mobile element jockey-like n=1 Tax=Limosa lapponica baueri TaxID=1758121 RepID=A0A2I0USB6_LIMLA|nr:rna-directed dna polymerase from mobile element jockey-like [Limosa lapponica baueri]
MKSKEKDENKLVEYDYALEDTPVPPTNYETMNHRMNQKENIGPLLNRRSELVTNNAEKAEVLNTFFTSVFTSAVGPQALGITIQADANTDPPSAKEEMPPPKETDTLQSKQVLRVVGGELPDRPYPEGGGLFSNWQPVRSGVLQGSILGPKLFNALISDLNCRIKCTLMKFADGTKLSVEVDASEGRATLQEDLDRLEEWVNKNLMKFNKDKCKVMHLGKLNPGEQHRLGSTQLGSRCIESHLGILTGEGPEKGHKDDERTGKPAV